MADATRRCWCGGVLGKEIGPHYRRCNDCGAAVGTVRPGPGHFDVADDEHDFYGKTYWTEYSRVRKLPDIGERARSDLSERCLFWMERLLEVTRPPGRFLEIGCGHGGFVRLMRELGFDAVGTELSGWVVEFARQTFDVPVLRGRLETLDLAPGFKCIAAFDVLEHLSDPLETVRRCADLLAPEGVLLLQTPWYRGEGPDWSMFQEDEHIYLFTQESVRLLLARTGFREVFVQSSLFPYDMWVVATRGRLQIRAAGEVDAVGDWRLPAVFRALLALAGQVRGLREDLAAADADRAARLEVIQGQGRQLGEVEAERNNLRAEVTALREHREVIEADRAARLEVIQEQGRRLGKLEARLGEAEAERDSRKARIETQERQILRVMSELAALRQVVRAIQSGRVYKLLRRLGRWKWVEQALGAPLADAVSASPEDATAAAKPSTFAAYRESIDRFNASQPNKQLLDDIRAYNHRMVDHLNAICSLRGTLVLDIGASPHGYALERALELGATLYVGVGLDISRSKHVVGDWDNVGVLLDTDATSLQFPAGMFDLVLSISTFEHVSDVDTVLSKIARVLKPAGLALLTFEPVWSCSYGHHLHHFGECAKLISPWAHLIRTPEQMRQSLTGRWPEDAPVSLDQAIEWVYFGQAINRLTIRDFRDRFSKCPLKIQWMIDLKEMDVDPAVVQSVSRVTGMSVDDLTTKGLSVLLRKEA